MKGPYHMIWVGALAALTVDVFFAAMKRFNVTLPGLA